ncbi:MAG TPA: sodium:proton exchanger [Candidatus Omnitrophica bacterium]|nr:sodium:proton exchanger [Candidatus Omnitrophota bacterium]
MNRFRKLLNIVLGAVFFLLLSAHAFASSGQAEGGIVAITSLLVIQLSVILFAAWVGNLAFARMKLPAVLGEIVAGVVIGPYFLGSFGFPGFEHGLFPPSGDFPVSIELYSLATIASIILLFFVGLETDIQTFLRFSFAGSIVGVFGVIFSFIAGDILGVMLAQNLMGQNYSFTHPFCLYLGVLSTATSVGITARILSEKRKMNSPEGVTILAAAVIDDVLGIIILAIILGMVKSGHIGWKEVSLISLKAFGIWLGFTLVGLKYSLKLSAVLNKIKDQNTIAILSLGLALLLAGIFEHFGLAMIIGAYVMGLSLSKTDLAFIVQEKLEMLQKFLVPIFFCVMGMLVNLKEMASLQIISFGMLYVVMATLGKIIGCSIPALFLNFNLRGALRIGVGMVPRGEVALIIAGIGLSSGIIDDKVFSIVMIMTFVTTLITPLVLDKMLDSKKPVLRKEQEIKDEQKTIKYEMPSVETAELLLAKVVTAFENEGFFVHRMGREERLFKIRKESVFIVMRYTTQRMEFDCSEMDAPFIHTLFYEVIAELEHAMQTLQTLTDKSSIGKKIFDTQKIIANINSDRKKKFQIISSKALNVDLQGRSKEEILAELVELLIESKQLDASQKEEVVKDLLKRELMMSTGMQNGIALPHAKTIAVDHVVAAVGISKEGVDFASLDKIPSKIFVLTLASKEHPHAYLQSMSEISRFLSKEENRAKMIACTTRIQLFDVLSFHM